MLRPILFCTVSVALLTVYGVEVCPFLESLGYPEIALILGTGFTSALIVRSMLKGRVVDSAPWTLRVFRQFWLDVAVFTTAGVILTVFNVVHHGFPPGSGMKMLVGCLLLGLLFSLDMAMAAERTQLQEAVSGVATTGALQAYRSVARLLAGVSISVLVLMCAVLFLVISKDLAWMTALPPEKMAYATRAVLIEVVFVLAVVVVLTSNVVLQYSRNLRLRLQHQTRVLDLVARGHFDQVVPISGRDELALIASRTNDMISGLREKERFRDVLGKVVSPEIAHRLLAGEGLKLGGERRRLVILFSDLRNFTSFSESRPPEEVVRVLNTYFARVVRIVREHGGVVDKFMGDGMLAVFGLDVPEAACDRALSAAMKMQHAVEVLAVELQLPLGMGVGIHVGEVIAGNVGSPERLEFTFIGDAVNTASRLESATKQVGAPLVISQDVLSALSAAMQALPWKALGEVALKGKQQALPLHGLTADVLAGLGRAVPAA